MKKRNLKSLKLQKITISNFIVGGLENDSDRACPSAAVYQSKPVCSCIPNTDDGQPVGTLYCEMPSGTFVSGSGEGSENA